LKSSLLFDPRDYDYGDATESIRSILAEWMEIDWFEPTFGTSDQCISLFREHQRLAHAQAPDLFSSQPDVRVVSGDRSDFMAWCQRVRSQTSWDWKFSVLKHLSSQHAQARNWSLQSEGDHGSLAHPRPGDLFFVFVDATAARQVIWNNVMPTPPALDALPREGFAEAARFYISYAHNDALDCVKWQLAERSDDMTANPFLPLLLCYQAGAYPFSLGRDTVVLFRFAESGRS